MVLVAHFRFLDSLLLSKDMLASKESITRNNLSYIIYIKFNSEFTCAERRYRIQAEVLDLGHEVNKSPFLLKNQHVDFE